MMSKIHVKPGQSVAAAIADATQAHDCNERAHSRSTMTFELGLDHVIINGHRILRPSGVTRSRWDAFWSSVGWKIIHMN